MTTHSLRALEKLEQKESEKSFLSLDVPQLAAGLLQYTQDHLCLLLDPEKPAWAVVNPTGMEIVKLCDGVRNIQTIANLLAEKYQVSIERARRDVLGYTQDLTSAGLLRSDAEEPVDQRQTPVLKGIYLHITNRCNLECKHCYATGMGLGELLSFEEICRLIDQVARMGAHSIALSGGEPLLRKDIKKILVYASERLETVLLTNGTLIDEDIADLLSHLGVHVQISLDGISPSVHESIRGMGTFERTMRSIELLLARDMGDQLALSISIMKPNLMEVPKLVEFALNSGISQVNMLPVVAQGSALSNWEQINPSPGEYSQLFEQLYPLIFEYREKLTIRGCLVDFIFGTLTNPHEAGCPAGEKLMVDSNGDVYPCPMISHPDYSLGNIRNECLSDIHSSSRFEQMRQEFVCRTERIARCQACHWRGFCRAACPGVALWQKGTIWDTDDLCDVRVDLYRKLIFRYAENARTGAGKIA
jgi:radical SAM protein with 4Fe4S-binding SPASM domain